MALDGGDDVVDHRLAVPVGGEVPVPRVDGHREELRLFLEAIRHGTPPPATVQEGLTVLSIIDALYTSALSQTEVAVGQGDTARPPA